MREYTTTSRGKIPILAVIGPTASGKTGLAIRIARQYGGEVISADSMQIYRGMNIATAKPTAEEMQGVVHHLIGFQNPKDAFSVAEYAAMAHETIQKVLERGKLPILAGGTGLYVDTVLDDLRFPDIKGNSELRNELSHFADEYGTQALWEKLRDIDPETASILHRNNRGRIIRAIEVWQETGISMAEHQRNSHGESRYHPLKIGLDYRDRANLYERINLRVDDMLKRGLLQEEEAFRKQYPKQQGNGPATAAQAIGYKELAGFREGSISLAEAVENLKRETRRYAKRQLTWFRRDPNIHWFFPDETELETLIKNIFDDIDKYHTVWYD